MKRFARLTLSYNNTAAFVKCLSTLADRLFVNNNFPQSKVGNKLSKVESRNSSNKRETAKVLKFYSCQRTQKLASGRISPHKPCNIVGMKLSYLIVTLLQL